ncbi:MAG: hypothetical protein IJE08_04335 [Clostridia bacterium]|nr:hypothetical protein [Clostridia bacterium]
MRRLKFNWDNEAVFLIVSVLYGLGTSFLSEGYIQAYLLELGMNVHKIGLYGTMGNAGALASYALFSFYKPRNNSYMTPMFVMALGLTILPIMLTLVSLSPQLGAVILFFSALHSFAQGFRASCDYCVVPTIMPRSRYGLMSGKCGMIGSGLAALVSALSASLMDDSGSMAGYIAIFIAAAASLAVSAAAIRFYRPMVSGEETGRKPIPGGRMTLKSAWILLPHLLRGVATGGFYYFVVISMERMATPISASSLIVTIGVIGTMVGCAAFMYFEKRMKTGTITLIGNLVAGLCAVMTAFNASPVIFFLLYFGYMMFNNISAYAIPAGVVYSVPAEELPFISSMRMLMMSVGSMVCIQLFSMLMTVWPAWTVMAISAAVYAAAGVIFKIQYTDAMKI